MTTKLHQDRTVVVAGTYDGARRAAEGIENAVLISASGHPLTIQGSLAGMHVAKAIITPCAREAMYYQTALDAVRRCLARSGGTLVDL